MREKVSLRSNRKGGHSCSGHLLITLCMGHQRGSEVLYRWDTHTWDPSTMELESLTSVAAF